MSLIEEIYHNPGQGLFSAARLKPKTINSSKQVQDFVRDQSTAQINFNSQKPKQYRSIVASKKRMCYQMDILDFSKSGGSGPIVKVPTRRGNEKEQREHSYILCVVDVYSRYACVEAMGTKTAPVVLTAMDKIFRRMGKPQNINCDQDFLNLRCKTYFEHHDITPYFSLADEPNKNAIVERFIGTLKKLIQKWRTEHGSQDWHNVLQTLVSNYNHTIHSTIHQEPINVWTGKAQNEQTYIHHVEYDLHLGDQVRIKIYYPPLDRRTDRQKFSSEVYTIEGIIGDRYYLDDVNGKPVHRYYKAGHATEQEDSGLGFKPYELLKVSAPSKFQLPKAYMVEKAPDFNYTEVANPNPKPHSSPAPQRTPTPIVPTPAFQRPGQAPRVAANNLPFLTRLEILNAEQINAIIHQYGIRGINNRGMRTRRSLINATANQNPAMRAAITRQIQEEEEEYFPGGIPRDYEVLYRLVPHPLRVLLRVADLLRLGGQGELSRVRVIQNLLRVADQRGAARVEAAVDAYEPGPGEEYIDPSPENLIKLDRARLEALCRYYSIPYTRKKGGPGSTKPKLVAELLKIEDLDNDNEVQDAFIAHRKDNPDDWETPEKYGLSGWQADVFNRLREYRGDPSETSDQRKKRYARLLDSAGKVAVGRKVNPSNADRILSVIRKMERDPAYKQRILGLLNS